MLFDLDDCLVDYEAAKQRGKACVSAALEAWTGSSADFWTAHAVLEPPLFSRFARGEITAGEYREARFASPASSCGWTLTHGQIRELNRVYMAQANGAVRAFGDARGALQCLRTAGLRVGVLTNGPSGGQRHKLAVSGLADLVDRCFVSEEIGVGKPDQRAFRVALAGLDAQPAHAAMVGDSFEYDIEPAIELGMRTVLVGRGAAPATVNRVARLGDVPRALAIGRGHAGARPAASRSKTTAPSS